MKHVVFIARQFPPQGGGGVQRAAKLAKYLVEHGYAARVIAAPPIGVQDHELLEELPVEVEVHRLPAALGARSGKWARAIKLGRARKALLRSLFFADEGFADLAETVALGLSQAHKAVAVIATSPPFSSIVAGAIIARRTRLPLIADLRDPWAYAPRARFLGALQHDAAKGIEDWALELASAVLCVSEPMRAHLSPKVATRAQVVPNGFDPADFSGEPEIRGEQTFRVVYAGSLYGARNPRPVLEVLRTLVPADRPLEVVIAGAAHEHAPELARAGLKLELRGYRPHKEVTALLRSADAILVIVGVEAADKHAPSGKLYEAIAAGPPVIAWAPKDGEAARILRETRAGIAAETPEELQAAFVAALEGRLEISTLAERAPSLVQYDRRTAAAQVARLLDRLS